MSTYLQQKVASNKGENGEKECFRNFPISGVEGL